MTHSWKIIEEDINSLFAPKVSTTSNWRMIAHIGAGFYNKKIILTGASGIIGTYFLEFFSRIPECEVYAVVKNNLPPHLKKYLQFRNIHFIRLDLELTCDTLPIADIIIHGAGFGQPLRFMANPLHTLRLNTFTTMELFKRLAVGGKLLFLSSSEIYNGANPPFHETDSGYSSPQNARSCYIEGKRCGEAIVHAFRESFNFDAKSARISLVYGPGTRKGDTRVLNQFIEKGATSGIIRLNDKGEALRTYCYIKNCLQMLIEILLNGPEEVYNVGGYSTVTIAELARKIGTIMNVPVEIPQEEKSVAGAPAEVVMDLHKVECLLPPHFEWVDLDMGLARTVEWQRGWIYSTVHPSEEK